MEDPETPEVQPVLPERGRPPVEGLLSLMLAMLSILAGIGFVASPLAGITLAGYDLVLIPLITLIFSLAGLILGIVSVTRKKRRTALAITGIVFNALVLIVSLLGCGFFLLVIAHAQ